MSVIGTVIVAALCLVLALALAFVPMRLLLAAMARSIAEPIRNFIARQRQERRVNPRKSPDRRAGEAEPAPPEKR
jgi:uncharacterized protein YqfA (UPF0365 family)